MSGVTVPMVIEGERIFVDGTVNGRAVRFWVDTGGGGLRFTNTLGLPEGPRLDEDPRFLTTPLPQVAVGGYPLDTSGLPAALIEGTADLLPDASPGHAQGFIPSRVLACHHVIFDYPGGTMSIDTQTNDGEELPIGVSDGMRFPRVELAVDGETRGFLLDTGTSMTIYSEAARDPDWQHWDGATGDATYFGGHVVRTFVFPQLRWGPFELSDVTAVSQPEGTFERWMSSMMSAPIVGALGGNVLQHFKITIDHPRERLFVERP